MLNWDGKDDRAVSRADKETLDTLTDYWLSATADLYHARLATESWGEEADVQASRRAMFDALSNMGDALGRIEEAIARQWGSPLSWHDRERHHQARQNTRGENVAFVPFTAEREERLYEWRCPDPHYPNMWHAVCETSKGRIGYSGLVDTRFTKEHDAEEYFEERYAKGDVFWEDKREHGRGADHGR